MNGELILNETEKEISKSGERGCEEEENSSFVEKKTENMETKKKKNENIIRGLVTWN